MNRLGWTLLALFVVVVAGFAMLVSLGGGNAGAPPVAPTTRTAASAQDTPTAFTAPSGLVVPVAGVRPGMLSPNFGDPRGTERAHGGLDIMAMRGTPVVAAAEGRVEKLFDSDAGGRTIYVRSPDGRWIYYYAHLDRYAAGLAEGAAVKRGQMIASVGATGNADPAAPHLHFEIKAMAPGEAWHEGRGVDPYPLLTRR